jgi:hypothetical protein
MADEDNTDKDIKAMRRASAGNASQPTHKRMQGLHFASLFGVAAKQDIMSN